LNPDKAFIDKERSITAQELPLEFMMNAMRLKNGVPIDLFYSNTGVLLNEIQTTIDHCVSRGLLELEQKQLRPTETGFAFLNELLDAFLPENFPQLASQANRSATIAIKEL
jgi:oxygen-independent coproporphyrinogen-3 oxidase